VRGPLPLADPSEPPSTPPGTTYAMARVDSSGRVTDRTISSALHWHPGDPLTITVTTGVVLIQRDPNGLLVLPTKPCISIPAAVRHHLRIATGDRLLLAATPDDDQLTIYPLATVHHALIRQHGEGAIGHD
jgi:hypothetical protein